MAAAASGHVGGNLITRRKLEDVPGSNRVLLEASG
jgi:hypothetical protein